ncbi:MAG: hypothetical protein VW405_01375 [Rhodospirillaceae bacterium]
MTETEAKAVAIDARQRHTGLPVELCDLGITTGLPNAGSVHGVMRLKGIVAERREQPLGPGMLSADQWQAAEWWLGRRAMWLRCIDAPGRETVELPNEAPELVGLDPAARARWLREWAHRVRTEWADISACLAEAQAAARSPVIAAFDVLLVRNQPVEHMEGDLRIGLNAVHSRFLAGHRQAA